MKRMVVPTMHSRPARYPLLAALALVGFAMGGCASDVQRRSLNNSYVTAVQAQAAGDWDMARRAYARAVVNAEQLNLPAGKRAVITYEYGRSLGVTCFYELAEKELNRAYKLDQEAGQPAMYSMVELGRMKLAMSDYTSSSSYFARALTELDTFGARAKAPAAYAEVLEDYALALSRTGNTRSSAEIRQRAAQVKAENPSAKSSTDRTPHGTGCNAG